MTETDWTYLRVECKCGEATEYLNSDIAPTSRETIAARISEWIIDHEHRDVSA